MALALSRKAVDNLGVRFRDRVEKIGDRGLIQDYRLYRSHDFLSGFENITRAISALSTHVSGRLKRTDTVIRKLRRESSMKLSFMDDIVGFRVLVASPLAQKEVTQMLVDRLALKTIRDYVDSPQSSGYRGVHLICNVERFFPGNNIATNLTFEIQIRTHFQHIWATTSESMGEQVKEGGGTPDQRKELTTLSERIRSFEIQNPEFVQTSVPKSSGHPVFFVMNYDKLKGRTVMVQSFQGDLERALIHYRYLEDQFSANLNSEIVLLAGSSEEVLKLSHMRYYRPGGRPLSPALDSIR